MKKLIAWACGMAMTAGLMAQEMPQMPPLPMDPHVKCGQLPNGLTYYIRHNELPEHHAEFYIAQRVGSILEEKNQRGLAHFLEHMAFNGTEHFPGKSMLNYLERNGVKFGANVNAYTSIEETVYNISDVPTDESHPGIVDSCLLILHDWSGCISLLDDEIEAERGVIHEEWRSRSSATQRMYNEIMPKLYPGGNRYADCMPIGSKIGDDHLAVVDDFGYQELRDYYHTWYRPDLQGIFVVGDVDVDDVEQKIMTLWSDIHVPEGAPERVYFEVEDNVEPLVAIASDPEQSLNVLQVMYKTDVLPDELKLTQVGYVQSIILNIITTALDQRLAELTQKADAPFLNAGTDYDNYVLSRTKDAFTLAVIFADGQYQTSLNAAMQVLLSAVQYGITEGEIDRIKADILSGLESAYNERDKRKNGSIVGEIQRHFLNAEPMPGIEIEYQMMQQMLPMLTADVINQTLAQLVTEQNVALMMMAQQKEGMALPTEQELLAAYTNALQQEVLPYEEAFSGVQLLGELPTAGSIVAEADGDFDSKVWTLSNGATVIWKKTDFKQDQILFEASSDGGTRLMPELPNIVRQSLGEVLTLGGLGDFAATDLPKVLAGKRAGVSASIGARGEGLSGSSTPKDIRTLGELIYLTMTSPRYDEEAYQAWYNRLQTGMQMAEGKPNKTLSDSLTMTLYAGQPSQYPVQMSDLQLLNYREMFDLGRQRFQNAGDFTFYFVGNIDEDSLRQVACQYIASLPATADREERPEPVLITRGSRQNIFDLPMQEPKTTVYNVFMLYDEPYGLRTSLVSSMLGQAVRMAFLETIREQEGAAYSPQAQGGMSNDNYVQLLYVYETGADKVDRAEELAMQELRRLADEGVSQDSFQKIYDYVVKRHQEVVKENGFWLSSLLEKHEWGIDDVTGYDAVLSSITAADLQALASRMLSAETSCIKFIARGVEK